MAYLTLALAALFFLAQAAAQRSGHGVAEEVVHEHAAGGRSHAPHPVIPSQYRRNSRSMSFMDYFFPSSRQAKVSKNFKTQKQLADPSSTVIARVTEKEAETTPITVTYNEETTPPGTEAMFSVTSVEGRATGSSKKGTTASGKRKASSRTTTAIPKIKSSQKVSPSTQSIKSTQRQTTAKPVTKQDTTYASTKTTHKHYTIHPSVVMTKTNPPTSLYKTKLPDSATSVTNSPSQGAGAAAAAEATTEGKMREGDMDLTEKPLKEEVLLAAETKNESMSLPDGSTVLAKPTKYHYYPHNQHIYLLPECAIQQVCNAVYVRLNYTQPLCACPSRHRDPCSASLNADDLHTTELTTNSKKMYAAKAVTLVKTCEATAEMRECRSPRDWSLLALQNIRTGKSHYLVICRCPEENVLEGPMAHDQPTYASVPGIRVYGMMCVQQNQYSSIGYNGVTSRPATSSYKVGYSQPNYNNDPYTRYPDYVGPGVYYSRMSRKIRGTEKRNTKRVLPPIPWDKVRELAQTADWEI